MSYPLPKKLIREFAENVREIYIIEELEPFIEEQVKAMGISVKGKDYLPICGELNPNIVRKSFLNEKLEQELKSQPIPVRPPVLCPGCPHQGVFYVLKKLRLNVTGDIGCYTLSTLPPLSALHTCICMGSSIGIAHGIDKAGEKKKTVAVIGDSTFIHSGITGLINIVYNKGTSTVIILNNRTTAMTGGQAHPATGYTLREEETKALDFAKLGEAIGIEHVCIIDPYDLDETERVIREEVERSEPSLIITNRPCILLDRKSRKPPKKIDQEVCKFCKLCLRLGCPALLLKEDRLEINPILCAGCGLCSRVCNSDAVA